MEGLLRSTDRAFAVAKSLSFLSSTNETLHSAGIEKLVYEDFYAEFASLIENIIRPNSEGMTLTVDLLLNAFQNPEGRFIFFLYSWAHTLILCSIQFCRDISEVPHSAIISSIQLSYPLLTCCTYSQPRYVLTVNHTKAL